MTTVGERSVSAPLLQVSGLESASPRAGGLLRAPKLVHAVNGVPLEIVREKPLSGARRRIRFWKTTVGRPSSGLDADAYLVLPKT
ncbi:MAG: hypothetical protein R2882_12510 [Gemmatimonadales bacterium]